jgi:hypothetical protein
MPPDTQLSCPASCDPSSSVRLANAAQEGPWSAPSVLAYCQIIDSISAGLRVCASRRKWRATCTMDERSSASPPGAGEADRSSATSFTGRLAGEVRSAGEFGTKESPVTTPPAPRVSSAVACCHCGLAAGGNDHTSMLVAG